MSAPLRVLVVEDNALNLALMRAVLELDDIVVEAATSGAALRALLVAAPPDIVLMDIKLADARGDELFVELRAVAAWAHVPVLAVTAHVLPTDRARLLRLGLADVLTKPIDTQALAGTVRRHAGRATLSG